MNIVRIISYVLVLVGALNWGLVGMFDFDLVSSIFGDMSILSRVIYSLVGVSAILLLMVDRETITTNT